MVFYQFQQAGNEEYQSLKKWNSVVGIVATGSNRTVAGKFATHDNFSMIAKSIVHSENFNFRYACIFRYVRNFLLLFFFFLSKQLRFWFFSFLPSL